ncbi:acyl-CoA N-acyltransferase [Auriculariales sp. MPI-PUGE-AT-0066]|nr:acyl-CoA N-acyltransferase [Auriculariales sp. MPI-PUGE-AT-0066]
MSFVLPTKDMQNDRVRLVRFNAIEHIPLLFKEHQVYPELWLYFGIPASVMASETSLAEWYDVTIEKEIMRTLWAVFDVETGEFTGCVGLFGTDVPNKTTEIGQHIEQGGDSGETVAAHACQHQHVRLLLRFCFDELRMRRVQWKCDAENAASMNAAQRLGFRLEGVMRWQRVLPLGCASGGFTRPGEEEPGKHGAMLRFVGTTGRRKGFSQVYRRKWIERCKNRVI